MSFCICQRGGHWCSPGKLFPDSPISGVRRLTALLMRKCRLSVCSSLENCISEGQKWEVLDDVYLPERIKKPRLTQREPKELSELSP